MISVRGIMFMGFAVGIAAALPAQTPTEKPEDLSNQIITGAWADTEKCNSNNATPVAFIDAAQGNGISKGECISITAYWAGRPLFANRADASLQKSTVTPRLAGRRVGIYADEQTLTRTPHAAQAFKIVGVYASCETEWPGALMVLGYCHYTDGPFLKVSEVFPATQRDVR